MMKKEKQYEYLIGKTREDIKLSLGEGFNYYHYDTWTYYLRKDWWGRHIMLYLYFEHENVKQVKVQKTRRD